MSKGAIELFYCYARVDKGYLDELDKHLSNLKRQYNIVCWSDCDINPGTEWKQEVKKHLDTAQIILLLISPDFMASNYVNDIELGRALKRHKEGTTRVVPIILRPIGWEDAPFNKLQVLPTDAKPVTVWRDRDEAYVNIVAGIKDAINSLSKEAEIRKGQIGELKACEDAIRLDPTDVEAWLGKGYILSHKLKRYEEALEAFEETLRLDPIKVSIRSVAWYGKGHALYSLKRYEEALGACEKALALDPAPANFWYYKGAALMDLKRSKEALEAFEETLRLDPDYVNASFGKGAALMDLKRSKEALEALEKALHLDATLTSAWICKGHLLREFHRYKEALTAYKEAYCRDPSIIDQIINDVVYILLQLGMGKEAMQVLLREIDFTTLIDW